MTLEKLIDELHMSVECGEEISLTPNDCAMLLNHMGEGDYVFEQGMLVQE